MFVMNKKRNEIPYIYIYIYIYIYNIYVYIAYTGASHLKKLEYHEK